MTGLNSATGRDRYFEERAKELRALVDPETGLLSAAYSKVVPCPLCGSDAYDEIFVKEGFPFVRCSDCELVFSNPQVDESLVLNEYRTGVAADMWIDVLTSPRQVELDRAKFAEVADALEPYRGHGRLLDVGCSIGLFLDIARDRGWDGVGTEFGARALAYARDELGLNVLDVPLEDAGFEDGSFDAVALLSVLEHLNDPRAMIRSIKRVLKPGGALYVITPNVESLACRVLHERAATFDGRNHLVYFSPSTIRALFELEGFRVERVTTTVSSLEAVLEWFSYREPYAEEGTGNDPLAAIARERHGEIERLLEQLDLGYKLHALAVRTES